MNIMSVSSTHTFAAVYLIRMGNKSNSFTLDGLTGLRFIAAFYVLLFHLDMRVRLRFLPDLLEEIFRVGSLGVTLFFVLSGFILTYTYQSRINKDESRWSFYRTFQAKRFARIYPAYLVAIIATVVVGLIFGFPDNIGTLVVLDTLMMNSYVPPMALQWFGGGGWSISTEFFFYLLFPFLLPLLKHIKSKNGAIRLLALFCILSAVPGWISHILPEKVPGYFVYTFPLFRISEFICGILTAQLVIKFGVKVKPIVAVLAVIVAAFYLGKTGFRFHNVIVHHDIIVPAIVLLIASIACYGNSRVFRWLSSKPMIYLGKISYSFYLMQNPLFLLFEHIKNEDPISSMGYWFLPVFTVVNLVTSIMLYEFVEHPLHARFTARIKRWGTKPVPTPVTLLETPHHSA